MFNFFKKKKPQKANQQISSISFDINIDGSIEIIFDWPDFNKDNYDSIPNIAKLLATTIYSINNNILEKDLINTLKNHDQSNPFNSLFVNNVFTELIYLEKNRRLNNSINVPLIAPSEVFKME